MKNTGSVQREEYLEDMAKHNKGAMISILWLSSDFYQKMALVADESLTEVLFFLINR